MKKTRIIRAHNLKQDAFCLLEMKNKKSIL